MSYGIDMNSKKTSKKCSLCWLWSSMDSKLSSRYFKVMYRIGVFKFHQQVGGSLLISQNLSFLVADFLFFYSSSGGAVVESRMPGLDRPCKNNNPSPLTFTYTHIGINMI